jgi:hypothetical protein
VDGFPRFVGLWVLTALTVVIAVVGMVFQLQQGQTGAVLFAAYIVVMTGGVVSVALLRRRLR